MQCRLASNLEETSCLCLQGAGIVHIQQHIQFGVSVFPPGISPQLESLECTHHFQSLNKKGERSPLNSQESLFSCANFSMLALTEVFNIWSLNTDPLSSLVPLCVFSQHGGLLWKESGIFPFRSLVPSPKYPLTHIFCTMNRFFFFSMVCIQEINFVFKLSKLARA